MTIVSDKSLLSGVEIIGSADIRETATPVVWSIDPASGVVQGPLDLCFVKGRTLVLTLEEDQVAVYTVDGELQSVFLEGIHSLAVSREGSALEPGRSLIHFLHLLTPLDVPWRRHMPVAPVNVDDPTSRLAHGVFEINIIDPIKFHRAFLHGSEGETDQVCIDALAQLLPTFLSIHLSRICGPQATLEKQSLAMADLDPHDLDAVLAPYGIRCAGITVKEGCGDILQPETSPYLPSIVAAC